MGVVAEKDGIYNSISNPKIKIELRGKWYNALKKSFEVDKCGKKNYYATKNLEDKCYG
ncbi:hypothetical protein Ddye_014037 [Dipteronia dyeriana]|uniref:Uncharacterized protein n=1 Tax=Dipteronia dyeriana TaxID=168575 RepID=A0AAD9X778_9ROSI|nr:hypothetical protein Ddye_014037 [Dipteronia dyeriana]